MTRIPFPAIAIAVTLAAAGVAALVRPGRWDVLAGSVLGTALPGAFAAVAVRVFEKVRRNQGEQAGLRLINAFVGLMAARMIGYVALVLAAVFLGAGEPVSVCAGLIVGTMVFQVLEVVYLRKAVQ